MRGGDGDRVEWEWLGGGTLSVRGENEGMEGLCGFFSNAINLSLPLAIAIILELVFLRSYSLSRFDIPT